MGLPTIISSFPLTSLPRQKLSREFPWLSCSWFKLQKGRRSTRVSTGRETYDIPPSQKLREKGASRSGPSSSHKPPRCSATSQSFPLPAWQQLVNIREWAPKGLHASCVLSNTSPRVKYEVIKKQNTPCSGYPGERDSVRGKDIPRRATTVSPQQKTCRPAMREKFARLRKHQVAKADCLSMKR